MLFHNLEFIFGFLPVVLVCCYLVRLLTRKWVKHGTVENIVLLLFSVLFFVSLQKEFLPLLMGLVVVDYLTGLLITNPWMRKHKVSAPILNVICLLHAVLLIYGLRMQVWGAPFYVLQAISYLVDIYRGKAQAQKNPLTLAVYLMMFPLIIAGPIVRYQEIEGQLTARRTTEEDFREGTYRLVVGWLKIVVLGITFGQVFEEIQTMGIDKLPVATAFFGMLLFFLMFYYLFAGVCDMAIGMGRMLGFHFPENFDAPYTALSVTEFWKKWHITLSAWFREYVYIPLGGNHCDSHLQAINLMITWIAVGLWHGFNVNSLLLGVYFGLIIICEMFFAKRKSAKGKNAPVKKKELPTIYYRIYTLALVGIGWMFMAFDTPMEMIQYAKAMLGLNFAGIGDGTSIYLIYTNLLLIFIGLMGLTKVPRILIDFFIRKRVKRIAAVSYWCGALVICIFGIFISRDIFSENPAENKYLCKISTYWKYLSDQYETQDIYFGADGYLFRTQKYYETDGNVLEQNMTALKELVDTFGEQTEIQTNSCILVPSAASIYPDKLPLCAPEWDEHNVDTLAQAVLGEKYVSTMQTLSDHSDEYIYYRSEDGVTTTGAYYVYRAWAEQTDLTPVDLVSWSVKTVTDDFFGSLARTIRMYPEEDSIIRYKNPVNVDVEVTYSDGSTSTAIFETKYIGSKEDLKYFLNGEQELVEIATSVDNDRNLLLFTDDSGRRYVQFLIQHFKNITVVNVEKYEGDYAAWQENAPATDVLFLFDMSTLAQKVDIFLKFEGFFAKN